MNFQPLKHPLTAVVFAALISGCGNDGNSDSNYTSNDLQPDKQNDQLDVNFFDTKYYFHTKRDAVKRVKWIYESGNRQLIQKQIIDNNDREGISNDDDMVLASNFESKVAKKNIKVRGNTIVFPLKDNNSDRTETYSIELIPINLKGVTAKNGNIEKETGLITDLNYFDKIPNTVSFPDGATCYVMRYTSTIPFYTFNQNDYTTYSSLEAWEADHLNMFGKDTPVIRVENTKVGANNQYPASRVVYDTNPNHENYNYNGIRYKGAIVRAGYTPKGKYGENADISKGAVNCTIVNDVAADFLEEQIVKYYR